MGLSVAGMNGEVDCGDGGDGDGGGGALSSFLVS